MDEVVIKDGQEINFGTLLGYSGMSGLCTGPHYHHEEHRKFGDASTNYDFEYIDRNFDNERHALPDTYSPIEKDSLSWNDRVAKKKYLDDKLGVMTEVRDSDLKLLVWMYQGVNLIQANDE